MNALANLTREQRQLGQARGVEVKREKALKRYNMGEKIATLVDQMERGDISELALALAIRAGQKLLECDLPDPQTSLDAVRLVEVMQTALKIVRLEAGESTSNAVTLHATADQMAELRARIGQKVNDAEVIVSVSAPTPNDAHAAPTD